MPSSRRFRGLGMTPAEFGTEASPGLWSRNEKWHRWPHINLMNRVAMEVAYGQITRHMNLLPVQVGKSMFWSLIVPVWILGNFPDKRIILGCYNSSYAAEWGEKARDFMEEKGEEYFGVKVRADHRSRDDWAIAGHGGGMRTMGMDSGITGHPADVYLVDDPYKGPEDSSSPIQREKIQDVYIACIDSRIQPGGAICITYTPWHEKDLGGFNLENGAYEFSVLRIPALAEEPVPDETRARKKGYDRLVGAPDPLGREPGRAICPQRFDEEHYRKKKILKALWFDAIYQLCPHDRDGSVFSLKWFEGKIQAHSPQHMTRVRYWDKAASQARGDWTVGLLMGIKDNVIWIEDVVRDRLGPHPRDVLIRKTAETDRAMYGEVTIWGETEPAGAGTDSSDQFAKNLIGFTTYTQRMGESKYLRAHPFASYCASGNVYLKAGHWVEDFLAELVAFRDDGKSHHDDQVDAASGAFSKLALTAPYEEPALGPERRPYDPIEEIERRQAMPTMAFSRGYDPWGASTGDEDDDFP